MNLIETLCACGNTIVFDNDVTPNREMCWRCTRDLEDHVTSITSHSARQVEDLIGKAEEMGLFKKTMFKGTRLHCGSDLAWKDKRRDEE